MTHSKTVIDEHETRVSVVTAIAADVEALFRNDPQAEKLLYAKAFQAWADGRIEGDAEDVFETVQEVLET